MVIFKLGKSSTKKKMPKILNVLKLIKIQKSFIMFMVTMVYKFIVEVCIIGFVLLKRSDLYYNT